jgi:hypothetical protein
MITPIRRHKVTHRSTSSLVPWCRRLSAVGGWQKVSVLIQQLESGILGLKLTSSDCPAPTSIHFSLISSDLIILSGLPLKARKSRMAIPKLYGNLARLPDKVLDRFTLYLQSPLHHTHRETTALWLALRPHHPTFEISDEALFASAFPEKKYDNARLRVLRSYLVEHLAQFLALSELDLDRPLSHRLVRRSARRYLLEHVDKAAWESQTDSFFGEPERAMEEYILSEDRLSLNVRQDNRGEQHDLHVVLKPLDIFYVTTRLKYLCAILDPTNRKVTVTEEAGLQEIIALYEALDLREQPLTTIYFHILKLFIGEEEEAHLPQFRALLKAHHAQIEAKERVCLYTLWWNYLNDRHNSGKIEGLSHKFQFYQEMIASDVVFEQGSITAHHFKNIVSLAARLGEYEWAQQFLDQYHHRLEMPWRTGVYAYCNGYLLFAQAKYGEAKRQLMGVEFYDSEYKISHQMLYLRIYYETNDIGGLESVKDALKIYLYRNTDLSPTSRESASNFSRFTARLFHLKGLQAPQKSAARVLSEMQNCPKVYDRNWLAAKAAELIERDR